VAFFEGFQSLIKKKKPKKKASPTLTTQSQNINMERRLKAAGAKVPKPKKKGNWFTRLMKALDHPANIVRTGVTAYYRTGSKQKAITAAKAARDKGVYTPGTKLLETMAKRGAPLAKWATKTPIRKAVSGFATDVLLDPLTYTTVGTRRVAMGIPELSKTISKEIAKETGKKLSRKSAERLAQNALKGQVPTGRMGTAIERAMGRKAETRGAATGYGKLTATEQKIKLGKQAAGKRQSMAELAKKAEELKQGKLPKSGALPPGKITDAEIRAQIARKEAKAAQLRQQSKKLKKGDLPKAGALPGRVRTDYVAGYKAFARSEPRTVQWAGREMDAKDLLKYQKNLEKQARRISRGTLQSVRHAYKAAKETDIYHMIRQRGGISPSKSGMYAGEYRDTIPIALRRKSGLPIDQMADELGMSVREMLDRLRNRVVPTSDDIRREAQQVAYSNPEFKRIMQEIGKIDDHISHLEQAGRKTTSGVEPFVAKAGREQYPKVTNVEAKRTGREMAKSLDQQSKLLSAEARKLTQQITPGEVTNIEARKLGRQLAKPYEQEAKGFARAARELEKQADKIKPKQGFAAVTEAAGKPGRDVTAIRFMGQDMIDITPIAKPIRTAMGAVIEASPFLTKVTDRLGRTFVFNYTPKGIKGLERELVKGAKERVTQTMREVPYSRSKAMRETLEKWKGVGREAAEEAPGIIEKTSGFASVAGRQAAEKAAKLFDYDVQKFAKEGIPLDVVDNYVQHIYKDPPGSVLRTIISPIRIRSLPIRLIVTACSVNAR
jgi:hypothetical protein